MSALPSPDPRDMQSADRPDGRFAPGAGSLAPAVEPAGDFATLDAVGRRALHVRLAKPDAQRIGGLCETPLACLK